MHYRLVDMQVLSTDHVFRATRLVWDWEGVVALTIAPDLAGRSHVAGLDDATERLLEGETDHRLLRLARQCH